MPRVLLIDDESGIRFALRRFFERAQWTVAEAADGTSAVEQLHAEGGSDAPPIDLVILDLNLPGVSGSQILEDLQLSNPSLAARVILTTGDAVADAEPGSVLAEHAHVLQKPFDLATLRMKVAELMEDRAN